VIRIISRFYQFYFKAYDSGNNEFRKLISLQVGMAGVRREGERQWMSATLDGASRGVLDE
jgi:hypothetical protein